MDTALETGRRIVAWARTLLASRRFPGLVLLLGLLLAAPSLGSGWQMDDYYHRAACLRPASLTPVRGAFPEGTPAGLFHFVDGEPAHIRAAMELGSLPWWTFPRLRARFFRPLTAVTHLADYRLWPASALLMHAHSLLWYAGLLLAAGAFYRRFLGSGATAGLALLLFAIDDAHATPVAWLANRNVLLAALFGIACVQVHDRWRRERWQPGAALAPLLLALSLLSAEAGICTLGYLASHALFLERGPRRNRLLALAPSVVVAFLWRALAVWEGVGTYGMGIYADPGHEPLRFLQAVGERLPVLLLAQWSPVPAELGYLVGDPGYRWLWTGALLALAAPLLLVAPLLRADRAARFLALGAVLSLVPVCGAFPDDRLLLFADVGGMGLLARFLARFLAAPVAGEQELPRSPIWRAAAGSVAGALAALHLFLPPALFPLHVTGWGGRYDTLYVRLPSDPELGRQSVVVVNGPIALFALYLPLMRATAGAPVPLHTRILFPSLAAVHVRRPDLQTLVLTPRGGFLRVPVDRIYRDHAHPLRPGDRVALSDMTAEVRSLTPDGRPAEVAFHFRVPLDDPSLRWVYRRDGAYVPFRPPGVGQEIALPAALR